MRTLTLGSLFDGIGGFPLAAIHNGIIPVWASEIEAFPIEVTRIRFPDMVHVGDITQLDGAELPPVDIICGGSPCQDLSVAGNRAGLSGARSGLFMEQVRLVKEMRNAERLRNRSALDIRPRFMVWENVPGAFSSGTPKGEDFRIVLQNLRQGRFFFFSGGHPSIERQCIATPGRNQFPIRFAQQIPSARCQVEGLKHHRL